MAELSVAIVDDNPTILNTLDEILKNEDGFVCNWKSRERRGSDQHDQDKTPDVVLLDLIMPKIDGISVVDAGEKRTSYDQESRIYYSQRGGRRTDGGGSVSGRSGYYLMKPLFQEVLVNKIRHRRPARNDQAREVRAAVREGTAAPEREEYIEHLERTSPAYSDWEYRLTSKDISIWGCHRHVGGRPGNDEQCDENSLSGHSQNATRQRPAGWNELYVMPSRWPGAEARWKPSMKFSVIQSVPER